MPVGVDLPLPLFVQALAVALGAVGVSTWVVRLFTRRNRDDDRAAERLPDDR